MAGELTGDRQTLLRLLRAQAPLRAARPQRIARAAMHPLAHAQRRYWFLDQLDPGNPSHHLASCNRLDGPLHLPALRAALADLFTGHEVLRSTFPVDAEEPVQLLDSAPPPQLELVEASDPEHVRELVRHALTTSFDLATGPLLRARLVRSSSEQHVLVLVAHHIVADGWSMDLLRAELGERYRSHLTGQAEPASPAPIQHLDLTAWQEQRLDLPTLQRHLLHWRNRLAGPLPVFNPVADFPRPPGPVRRAAAIEFRWPAELVDAARQLAAAEGATLNMAMHAAFVAVLARYFGQPDLVIGVPVANRDSAWAERIVGPVSNTLPVRVPVTAGLTFRGLLARVRQEVLAGQAHSELPFDLLVEQLRLRPDPDRNPVFQVLFQLLSQRGDRLDLAGLTVSRYSGQLDSTGLDLELLLTEDGTGLLGTLRHHADLFDRSTMDRLLAALRALLADGCAHPDRDLTRLDVAAAAPVEGDRLGADVPDLLPQLAARAAAEPDRVLLSGPDSQLSAAALWRRAGAVAAGLVAAGVRPGELVGLLAGRGTSLLVGLLGCWRAGAAFVPLDPSFPPARLRNAVEDAEVRVVLLDAVYDLAGWPIRVLPLAELPDAAAPDLGPLPTGRAAYAMFTSGSTGRPKGIVVPHTALASFLAAILSRPGFYRDDVLLAVTTLSFDISLLELLTPLLAGGRTVIAGAEDAVDGRRLAELLDRHGATIMQATPASWRLMVEAGWRGRPSLRACCGGEALPAALAGKLTGRVAQLWNLYGPTEATIWATRHLTEPDDISSGQSYLPIGAAIGNTRTVVLADAGERVPDGACGELLLGGDGIAWGYLRRPDLTAERFRPDPAGPLGSRGYLTGDTVRTRADGALTFVGRQDHQVKLRGFRIELGDLEAVLEQHQAVAAAVARVHDEQLVVYLIAPTGQQPPDTGAARAFAAAQLPPYLLPDIVMPLPALPLTPNGKVDRLALPAPVGAVAPVTATPARTARERTLARLWAGVLGLETVGRHDSFLDLGGNSIRLAALRSRLEGELGRRIDMIDLFRNPTVAAFAAHLDQANPAGAGSAAERARGQLRRELARARTDRREERR